MGGPFAFLVGLVSLLASFGLYCREQSLIEAENKKYKENNYSYIYQNNYDMDDKRKIKEYNIMKIVDSIRDDYPEMKEMVAIEIAKISIAKRMMESETPYNYHIPEKYKSINFDKYATDEFKYKVGVE